MVKAMRHLNIVMLVFLVVLEVGIVCNAGGLKKNFYKKSCPGVEKIVRDITWNKTRQDSDLSAHFTRLLLHDCFVEGCDGSIFLDRKGTTPVEKDAEPNLTLEGFEDIDDIKAEVEKVCPGVVSCADILFLAARDAVSFQFKRPLWEVLTGRRDGTVSLASNVDGNIPSPFSDFTTLLHLFNSKGLSVHDLVVLSGAHTLGNAHCKSFSKRLYNFTGKGDIDRSLDPNYAKFLKTICPINTPANSSVTADMDPQSADTFDNHYYKNLLKHKGLFQSDASLLTNRNSDNIVKELAAKNNANFISEFGKSVTNLGNVGVLTGYAGQIRKLCRFVN